MSGGHFDYGCFKISQFAEELRHEIETNSADTRDSDYAPDLKPETIKILERCYTIIKLAGDLAYGIEWMYSSDTSEEFFVGKAKELLKNSEKDNYLKNRIPIEFNDPIVLAVFLDEETTHEDIDGRISILYNWIKNNQIDKAMFTKLVKFIPELDYKHIFE